LREAQAKGRGLLFVTAHYGDWELMTPLMVAMVKDREVGVVARDLSNPWLNEVTVRTRQSHGARVFPRGGTGRDYIRYLREGNGLAVLGDIDTSTGGGIFVDFFGRRACTNKGLALLVLSTGAPVVPGFMIYEGKGRYRVEIQPPVPWLDFDDRTKNIEENTAQYHRVIEAMARRYPDHYFWVHQRWKTRPYQPWPREER